MSYKKTIVTGTLILAGSGFLSRILGFYNRIFLSNLIGAKELGIYQLILPLYLLGFTLCCHGFELGVSNLTSRYFSGGRRREIRRLVRFAALFSLAVSVLLFAVLHQGAAALCHIFLKEDSAAPSLRIVSFALPFVAVKSCLHGYYLGKNHPGVPAVSQLVEQSARVGSIVLLSCTLFLSGADARIAAWGMVIGEAASTVYTALSYAAANRRGGREAVPGKVLPRRQIYGEFLRFSLPVSVNHLSLTAVSSLENILIPFMLARYFGSQETALSVFGTLTGMAIPFLYFPATITNSLSAMLLPAISASWQQKKMAQIRRTISYSLHYCILIGVFSACAFLLFGNLLGELVFGSALAGHYVYTFAILCPFLYVAQTTTSILNGFGKTTQTLFHSLLSVGVRIGFILFAIPSFGVRGYLYGLLCGYGLQIALNLYRILRVTAFPFCVEKTLLLPTAASMLSGWASSRLYLYLEGVLPWNSLLLLAGSGCLYCLLFLLIQFGAEFLTA